MIKLSSFSHPVHWVGRKRTVVHTRLERAAWAKVTAVKPRGCNVCTLSSCRLTIRILHHTEVYADLDPVLGFALPDVLPAY